MLAPVEATCDDLHLTDPIYRIDAFFLRLSLLGGCTLS